MAKLISAFDRNDPLPYPVVKYIERYVAFLDSCRFVAICLVDHAKEIRDKRTSRMHNIYFCTWIKR